jgi:type II secretory pathway pseudopilin PulG
MVVVMAIFAIAVAMVIPVISKARARSQEQPAHPLYCADAVHDG